jgi:hypothetical protein
MCRTVACKVCGKVTWTGCGLHVDQVLAGVPAGARCLGHPKPAGGSKAGWLSRVLGRS